MTRPSALRVPGFYPALTIARPRTQAEYADIARLAWEAAGHRVEIKVLPNGEIWSATVNGLPAPSRVTP
jgi:hypothetical protein